MIHLSSTMLCSFLRWIHPTRGQALCCPLLLPSLPRNRGLHSLPRPHLHPCTTLKGTCLRRRQ